MLYREFTQYIKDIGTQNKPTMKSFTQNLKAVGIDVQRKRCKELRNRQVRRYELSPKIIYNCLSKTYGEIEIHQDAFSDFIHLCKRGEKRWTLGPWLTDDILIKYFKEDGWLRTTEPPIVNVSSVVYC